MATRAVAAGGASPPPPPPHHHLPRRRHPPHGVPPRKGAAGDRPLPRGRVPRPRHPPPGGRGDPPPPTPARPAAPTIVAHPPSAKDSGVTAEVFYLHSLAHVELNAIDLAADTLSRFAAPPSPSDPPPPRAFITDFVRIAADEARHFGWLSARLAALGVAYGDLPAHGLVWASADATRTDLAARLALGQLVQEARGLDAGPRLAGRLVGGGWAESAALVRAISAEEVPHVAAGVRWFVWAVEAGVGGGAGGGRHPRRAFSTWPCATPMRARSRPRLTWPRGTRRGWGRTGTCPSRKRWGARCARGGRSGRPRQRRRGGGGGEGGGGGGHPAAGQPQSPARGAGGGQAGRGGSGGRGAVRRGALRVSVTRDDGDAS
ncbi:hypothetical protein BU14_0371s0006 [Porphyra umbilicalis]|uniref:Uncharacterized protein n=1 Tax=Porphyra umbilicalis TaxID=2786 RepID=A0A1X6NX68_PORUM|nr:hypothetical protein BU14_0371s0006 [Porphyra umbilicalis]|eukprot:OSX73172.1 hypothetical protein BU14_0371s0006 [Porphyra umbilicalis]